MSFVPLYGPVRGGSPFISTGQEWSVFECDENKRPDNLVLYDGATNAVPTLAARDITFLPEAGSIVPFSIRYPYIDSALVACASTATKFKTRSKCFQLTDCDNAVVSITISRNSTCKFPEPVNQSYFVDAGTCTTAVLNCSQRIAALVAKINANPYSIVTASATSAAFGGKTFHYLELEAKDFGYSFQQSNEGMFDAEVLTPFVPAALYGADIKKWYPTKQIPASMTDGNEYKAIVIVHFDPIPASPLLGSSSGGTDNREYLYIKKVSMILFDSDDTESAAAFTALGTILAGNSEYNKILGSTTCANTGLWNWCVTVTDAGDGTALTTASELVDNNTNFVTGSFSRVEYVGGVSYYAFQLKTATAPGVQSGHTYRAGTCVSEEAVCATCV